MIKSANGTSFIEPSGYVGDRALAYYEALAKGGIGLLIVESCGVEYPLGVQHPPVQFHLDEDKFIPSYAELVNAVHRHGCPVFIQFQHAGPWNPTGMLPIRDTKAASAMTKEELPGPDFAIPRAMRHEEVKEYVDIWAKAAERAAKAGFDGVEVNGGTCHQINTFLSRIWNKREDEYGPQSIENRARFMCEIVSEIKKRLGQDYPVQCLINIVEYGHEKATTVEEGVQIAKLLQQAGADSIQCRAHGYGHRGGLIQPDRILYPVPPDWLPKNLDWSRKGAGATVPLVEAVKKQVTVPVYASCRLDPVLGEKFLRQGKIDFVPMVRRLLADPEIPNKVAEGRLKDIRPCVGCLYCMDVRNRNKPLECRVNPNLGREREYVFNSKPAEKKKKVLVIGAGPAGLEAALIARQRGHDVILVEKSGRLGGLIPIAAVVKDLETEVLMDVIRYFRDQLIKAGVKINLRVEATPELIDKLKPEVIIVAVGGKTDIPQIPGINGKNVSILTKLDNLITFFGPKLAAFGSKFWMPIGKHAVVMGGEHHGCEIAEFLVKRGRRVTIVHPGEALAEGMTKDDSLRLIPWFEKNGVKMYTGAKYEEVTPKGLVITTKEGERITIEANTVVPSLSLKENTDLLKLIDGKAPEIYDIGSCTRPQPDLIVDAIADGARVGHMI